MAKARWAAMLLVSASAVAQPPSPGASPSQPSAASDAPKAEPAIKPEPKPGIGTAKEDAADELRREVDSKVEAAKTEMREEIRAQMATQSLSQGWKEEVTEDKRKLELLSLDGYLRVRPDLFNKFDLNREPDPSGYYLFPHAPGSARTRTMSGVNMRLRLDPTINVSEDVRIRMQADGFDNLILGSTPDYAFSRSERIDYGLLSETQLPPTAGVNAAGNSIVLKRAYGEVSTPVGILRFGRMGSQWGLGMVHNDGNCLDCDFGETVDRIQFQSEPFPGWYVIPMLDFNLAGPSSGHTGDQGQPFLLSNGGDATSYVVAIARKDTDQQAKAKLQNGQAVFNGGVHFTYRQEKNEATDYYNTLPYPGLGGDLSPGANSVNTPLQNVYVPRGGTLYLPDAWVKYERKAFRVELEAAALLGTIGNRSPTAAGSGDPSSNQALNLVQFGGVLQGEYRLVDGKLHLQMELGYASGDPAPGFGNYPRRKVAGADNITQPGDIDGPQYACPSTGGCTDNTIRNFRFNRDYRVDLILWRELLGGITDTLYLKPSVNYELADGFHLFASVIYSRAVYKESTPSYNPTNPVASMQGSPDLGVEIDAGVRYETEDGFYAVASYGILFPLAGLYNNAVANPNPLDNAQALRGQLGVRF